MNVLLMPNITLTSLLIGLDLSYETSDFTVDASCRVKISPASFVYAAAGERLRQVLVISCITGMGTAEKSKRCWRELWRADVAGHLPGW